ncbi:MAG: STAS domain-containing protein [Ignavibacterium sp.]|nr:STAS domain-containing protein [Ignavibacterium sp.]
MYDNDFIYEEVGDICIEPVNFTRATLKETETLRSRIQNDINNGKTNIIIDLSLCDFCDSSFIGALVVCTKKSFAINNKFSIIIQPESSLSDIFHATRLDKVLSIFKTRDEALKYFDEIIYKTKPIE